MAYDDRARATAARMLAPKASGGKGQVVTLTSADGGYNPATGKATAATGSVQTGSGVEMAYSAREIDGANVQRGDVKFMLSPVTTDGEDITTAEVGAILTYETGVDWRVMAAEPFSPAGVVTHFDLQLRRS